MEVFANFTESARNYTITFKNFDGTILDVQTVAYQASIADSKTFFIELYDGVNPHKSSTETHKYTFNENWLDEAGNAVTTISLDMVIFADFTETLRESLNTNTTDFWSQVSSWFNSVPSAFWIGGAAVLLISVTTILIVRKKKKI